MDRPPPSLFLLVPGPWATVGELTRALAAHGVDAKLDDESTLGSGEVRVQLVEDEHFDRAFAWGRGGALDAQLLSRIGRCKRAALVEVGYGLREHASDVARVGRALRDVGGLAVRMEVSGSASPWERWLECLESESPSLLYESAVTLVEGEGGALFTCGMHVFDLPDAEITLEEAGEASDWLDAFCVYQIEENPTLTSGHTFRPTADAEPRVLERSPDGRHDSSDGRHNPFGLWHLKARGAARIEPSKLTLTFVPSLVAILAAAENSKGSALTQSEVEAIVAHGAVIAMEPVDARALERSRGYADIEPELAWEQWQIVREGLG